MACRLFSFTLISANNLPDIRNLGRMKVYAKVSLRGIADTEYKTSVDKLNDVIPKWSCLIKYWISQSALEEGSGVILDVKLYSRRTLGDRYVGQININLKKLFESSLSNPVTVTVDDSQTTEGTIEFSYDFGDLQTVDVKKNEQSFLGVVVKETTMALLGLLAEGVIEAVLVVLGA